MFRFGQSICLAEDEMDGGGAGDLLRRGEHLLPDVGKVPIRVGTRDYPAKEVLNV